jgi:SAM-dependent methyltransferase
VDRYYIERFLSIHAADVRGRVLELGDDAYTRRYGRGAVTRSDVLHLVDGNPAATIVADLTRGEGLESDAFDCIVFTQSLQMIYDLRAALATLWRILRPGGVLLLTTHGTSAICRREGVDDWGEYWRFTSQGLRRLLGELVPEAALEVEAYGNVLAAAAFLYGLAADELRTRELEHLDRDYEVIVAARALKPGSSRAPATAQGPSE